MSDGTSLVLGVPTLNRYDLCERLVASARAGSRPPDLIVVIDNGGALHAGAFGAADVRCPVEVLTPGRNLGVGPSWNLLARKYLSRFNRALICGDDVLLHQDTIEMLLASMEETGADLSMPDPALSSMHQMFSCFLVRQSLFEKVGYFDEQFWPAYFEDNDFHRRMKIAGAIESVARCGYEHVNSATMQKYTGAELERHHERFRACRDYYMRKWGGLPGAETFAAPFNGRP